MTASFYIIPRKFDTDWYVELCVGDDLYDYGGHASEAEARECIAIYAGEHGLTTFNISVDQ
jgi:hypothetical protein